MQYLHRVEVGVLLLVDRLLDKNQAFVPYIFRLWLPMPKVHNTLFLNTPIANNDRLENELGGLEI